MECPKMFPQRFATGSLKSNILEGSQQLTCFDLSFRDKSKIQLTFSSLKFLELLFRSRCLNLLKTKLSVVDIYKLFFFLQHVVVQVELGEKTTTRFKSSSTEFTKFAMENVRINNPLLNNLPPSWISRFFQKLQKASNVNKINTKMI